MEFRNINALVFYTDGHRSKEKPNSGGGVQLVWASNMPPVSILAESVAWLGDQGQRFWAMMESCPQCTCVNWK